ncbi:diphthine synthase [Candidatus Woesearchaeota archaeon]|nr:diphthine synthase [Candidatus Woesearchaeota archaeon]
MLYIIGIGLSEKTDISMKGLWAIRQCQTIFLEGYTSALSSSLEEMEDFYGKKITVLDREDVEQAGDAIVEKASKSDVAFLVVGDVFSATTHIDIWLRAKKAKIPVRVIHGSSVITAVGITGLEVYNFGKVASIPYPKENFKVESFYDVLKMNKQNGLHTLFLLDLDPKKDKFMTVREAINLLLEVEKSRNDKLFTEETFCVACAALGSSEPEIEYGKTRYLHNLEKEPRCLIVPGNLHFMEEEALNYWKVKHE